ncbi:Kinesin heavy chain [Gossypium arboreum]|uniref:Kinesin heavy chain n=1 Tax=Gossypium arboreum TaxID=29729 RepID=A0A0B0MDA9_GOSAR|nr:Kinesin heavy chain [Gossypium arboreum]
MSIRKIRPNYDVPSKPCAGEFDRALCLVGLVPVNKYQTLGLAGLVPAICDDIMNLVYSAIHILVVSYELGDCY